MPVSVELKLTPTRTLGTTGSWPIIEFQAFIRTQGRSVEFTADLSQLQRGVTAFFEELKKRKISRKRVKQLSMKQETACAESVGGQRQKGSGNLSWNKGDGRVRGRYRIENKFRTAASITVKLADLQKIRAECVGLEVPVFDILFREKGTLRPLDNWVLLPKDHWEKLANADPQADDDR